MPHPIVIIGSGLGGCAAAATLSARGHRVLVLERNAWAGGKAAVVRRMVEQAEEQLLQLASKDANAATLAERLREKNEKARESLRKTFDELGQELARVAEDASHEGRRELDEF